jgi:hypothetical protein
MPSSFFDDLTKVNTFNVSKEKYICSKLFIYLDKTDGDKLKNPYENVQLENMNTNLKGLYKQKQIKYSHEKLSERVLKIDDTSTTKWGKLTVDSLNTSDKIYNCHVADNVNKMRLKENIFDGKPFKVGVNKFEYSKDKHIFILETIRSEEIHKWEPYESYPVGSLGEVKIWEQKLGKSDNTKTKQRQLCYLFLAGGLYYFYQILTFMQSRKLYNLISSPSKLDDSCLSIAYSIIDEIVIALEKLEGFAHLCKDLPNKLRDLLKAELLNYENVDIDHLFDVTETEVRNIFDKCEFEQINEMDLLNYFNTSDEDVNKKITKILLSTEEKDNKIIEKNKKNIFDYFTYLKETRQDIKGTFYNSFKVDRENIIKIISKLDADLKDIKNTEVQHYILTEYLKQDKNNLESVIMELIDKSYLYDYPSNKHEIMECFKQKYEGVKGTKQSIQENVLKMCFIEQVKRQEPALELTNILIEVVMKEVFTLKGVYQAAKKIFFITKLDAKDKSVGIQDMINSQTKQTTIDRYTKLKSTYVGNEKLLFILIEKTSDDKIQNLITEYTKNKSKVKSDKVTLNQISNALINATPLETLNEYTEVDINKISLSFLSEIKAKLPNVSEDNIKKAGLTIFHKTKDESTITLESLLVELNNNQPWNLNNLYKGIGVAALLGVGYYAYKKLNKKSDESLSKSSGRKSRNKSVRRSNKTSNRRSNRRSNKTSNRRSNKTSNRRSNKTSNRRSNKTSNRRSNRRSSR